MDVKKVKNLVVFLNRTCAYLQSWLYLMHCCHDNARTCTCTYNLWYLEYVVIAVKTRLFVRSSGLWIVGNRAVYLISNMANNIRQKYRTVMSSRAITVATLWPFHAPIPHGTRGDGRVDGFFLVISTYLSIISTWIIDEVLGCVNLTNWHLGPFTCITK